MDDKEKQALYAMWRFDAWLADLGTYRTIDELVSRGILKPGEPLPTKEELQQMAGGRA
jgi:hypothetical protein